MAGDNKEGEIMLQWMILPFKRYAQFSGRSRRMEFWSFFLLNWTPRRTVGFRHGVDVRARGLTMRRVSGSDRLILVAGPAA